MPIDINSLADIAKSDNNNMTVATILKSMENEVTKENISAIGTFSSLATNALIPFPNQPFKLYIGERLDNLSQSIQNNGVLTPIIVRPLSEDNYQIISGHNRVAVCKSLGIEYVPCIIKALDDDQAWIELIENNLNQRQDLLPSERAWAYRIRQEKIGKKVGRPPDMDKLCHEWHDLSENENTNTQEDTARRTLYRYIRLTYLVVPLLDMVDEGGLSIVAGEEISNISVENQSVILEWLKSGEKVTPVIASKIRKMADNEPLTVELLKKSFTKQENKDKPQLVLKMSPIRKIVGSSISQRELTELIIELLKKHYIKEENTNDN